MEYTMFLWIVENILLCNHYNMYECLNDNMLVRFYANMFRNIFTCPD